MNPVRIEERRGEEKRGEELYEPVRQ